MSSYPAPNPPPPVLGVYNELNWYSKEDPTGPVGPQGVQGGIGIGTQGFQGNQGFQGASSSPSPTIPLYYQRDAVSIPSLGSLDLGIVLSGQPDDYFELTLVGVASAISFPAYLDVFLASPWIRCRWDMLANSNFKWIILAKLRPPTMVGNPPLMYVSQTILARNASNNDSATSGNISMSNFGGGYSLPQGNVVISNQASGGLMTIEYITIKKYVP